MTDIVSFAGLLDAKFLARSYRALLFTGWNTCSTRQYRVLIEYVTRGGTLFVAIPHLSTNRSRNYLDYSVDELVNGGDVGELCGVRVTGRGPQFYWAVAPGPDNPLQVSPYRKFGVFMGRRGTLELTGNPEILAVEDATFQPVLLRHRLGKGVVYFLNTWEYPGAWERDIGPGASVDSLGLVGEVYRRIALDIPREVYITDDGCCPGPQCAYVAYSFFPSQDKVFLLNTDFTRRHTVVLHHHGKAIPIVLNPSEWYIRNQSHVSRFRSAAHNKTG